VQLNVTVNQPAILVSPTVTPGGIKSVQRTRSFSSGLCTRRKTRL